MPKLGLAGGLVDSGGNGDEAVKKIDLTPWGNQADVAKQQGWYPETVYKGDTTYRSPYDLFNSAVIPGQKKLGHIAIISHPDNTMDIVLRDADSNILQQIKKGISPQAVQEYIRSTVGNRVDMIQQGKNLDKPDGGNQTYAVAYGQ